MFKKLKDKLAEEVKSSPQRIQQFAQAAQAAVTSASSSISDITNTDLFSIGDNDSQQARPAKAESLPNSQTSTFQDVSLGHPTTSQTGSETMDYTPHDIIENQRQRRLSNSSFASDVSFRLPTYESPSMYHLQSDMEISASEAEDKGFSGTTINLDRVTKEQIYAAYRRTQERYTKYRTQYADLARHYKLLERENAKAKSVLVETQDKALRRISELREQCNLEQSAKAHLEKALRVEIEERNMKIGTLETKINFLQNNHPSETSTKPVSENIGQLINLLDDNEKKQSVEDSSSSEILINNKIEKLEQLLIKYKESLKQSKEKNGQLTTELQRISSELENKCKENEELKSMAASLNEVKEKNRELNDLNEELQNKINSYDFTKTKELSTLESDLQKAQEQIQQLCGKIEIFTKREEEYAISLAENKLSIHKELEAKENEIKSLKDNLNSSINEIQSLQIVINDYKNRISSLEDERSKFNNDINELNLIKAKVIELETQLLAQTQKCQSLENTISKSDEEFKCLQLQLKQETAEKLAMIDRNGYLENRNSQLSDEIAKKSSQISSLDNELQSLKKSKENSKTEETDKNKLMEEIDIWKTKYSTLESEIQEEREELVKLQSEIEKLLTNHELIQLKNTELQDMVSKLKFENDELQAKIVANDRTKILYNNLYHKVKQLQQVITLTSQEAKSFQDSNNNVIHAVKENIQLLMASVTKLDDLDSIKASYEELKNDYLSCQENLNIITEESLKRSNELKLYQSEYDTLKEKVQVTEKDNLQLKETLKNVNEKYEKSLGDLENLKKYKENLVEKLNEYENKYSKLEETIKYNNEDKEEITRRANALEKNNLDILEKEKALENENITLRNELLALRENNEDNISELKTVLKEKDELIDRIKTIEHDKIVAVEKLKNDIKNLTQDNISLQSQSEKISKSVKVLECEISEVRKSHSEMEDEKNRLNVIIEKLENNERKKKYMPNDQITQTDEILIQSPHSVTDAKSKNLPESQYIDEISPENDVVKEIVNEVSYNPLQNTVEDTKELSNKYNTLKDEYNSQKEENRRLQSDIAGLQTYLTKISKENSILNDKLRELMASSENSPDKAETLSRGLTDLQNEIQLNKERIDDLMRENTLLIDENLELKDQLSTQNYKPAEKQNVNRLGNIDVEKYNLLLETKKELESRLNELEHVNNSVNRNMTQVQENNEKLRLSNEKLERRLDEALVSLRHLHSLQENTELEYLRNILYEYLTGSGTHSVTLAKVLAAVVKFDDMQTQQVLQKEKERQGLLRQLGII